MALPVLEVLKQGDIVDSTMTIFGTGHRPEKVDLDGWDDYVNHRAYKSGRKPNRWVKLEVQLAEMLKTARAMSPVYVITGAQRGMDLVLAAAALKAGAYHILAVPFPGFNDNFWKWTQADRLFYANILAETDKNGMVVDLRNEHPKGKGACAKALDERNQFMVDLAILIAKECKGQPMCIALHDGTAGGTNNCINYAARQGMSPRRFITFRPNDLSYTMNGKRYLECSTNGYGPSALTEVLYTSTGLRSIEDIYQSSKLDGNKRPYKPSGKGKQAKFIRVGRDNIIIEGKWQSDYYRYLWYRWFVTTNDGAEFLTTISQYDVFTDAFGGLNSQADVMRLVREKGIDGLKESVEEVKGAIKKNASK